MSDKTEVYKGQDGQWYWRKVAPNGKVIAVGGEGYSRKWNAKRAAKRAQ